MTVPASGNLEWPWDDAIGPQNIDILYFILYIDITRTSEFAIVEYIFHTYRYIIIPYLTSISYEFYFRDFGEWVRTRRI